MRDRTDKYPKLAVVVYDPPGQYHPGMASGDAFGLMCEWSGCYGSRSGASRAAWNHLRAQHRLTKKDGTLKAVER